MKDTPAHLIASEDDGYFPFWKQELICSDGTVVIGTGSTQIGAEQSAAMVRDEMEKFLKLSNRGQLKTLAIKETINDADKERMLRIITNIILELTSNEARS